MSRQLIYTSAPRGLKPGSSGFCTVAADGGMSQTLMTKMELLSGYEFRYNLSDPKAERNPINFCHTRITLGGQAASVLSRVAFSGADYSGRTNKIAHHFLLEQGERLPGGPAWMMREMVQSGHFRTAWDNPPEALASVALPKLLPQSPPDRQPLREWSQLGDPGWAGLMAKAFCRSRKVPAYVIFEPGMDLLVLFEESLRLLPANMRWGVHFATYYTSAPPDCHYHWRGVLAGSSVLKEVARFPGATVLDLTKPLGHVHSADDDEFTAAAREGCVVPTLVQAPRPRPVAKVAQVEGVPIPLGQDDYEEDPRGRAWDSAMADLTSAAKTAPRSAAPPPHFVTVEKPPRWMKWTLSALALLVCALVVSNATTLWLLHRSGQNGDASSTDSTPPPPVQGQAASTSPATAPAESDTKTPETPPGATKEQPGKNSNSPAGTGGPSTQTQASQPATPGPAVQMPTYALASVTRLVAREGKVSDKESEIVWLDQEWTEGPATLVCKLASNAAERWLLLDFPLNAKQKLGLRAGTSPEDGLSVTQGSGPSAQTLVEGTLKRGDDGKTVLLECNLDRKAWADEKVRQMIQFLVLEVRANDARKTARFVLRPEGRQDCTVRFGWLGDKKPTLLEFSHAEIKYPWATLLHGRPEHPDGDKGGFKPVRVKIGNKDRDLRIAIQKQEKNARVALSSPELDKKIEAWAVDLADQRGKLKEASKGPKKEQQEDRNKREKVKCKAGEAIDKLIGEIKAMSKQLKSAGPIIILDPWDLPVAEVTIELVVPSRRGTSGGGK